MKKPMNKKSFHKHHNHNKDDKLYCNKRLLEITCKKILNDEKL